MESPNSTWSEAIILSDDSGLLLTNSSISSGSMSGESRSGRKNLHLDFPDSYSEYKSLSQDSLDGMSDIMCCENFNTLKKGKIWNEIKQCPSPIEPPPEFQDKPKLTAIIDIFASSLSIQILSNVIREFRNSEVHVTLLSHTQRHVYHLFTKPCWTPEFIPFSPCHSNRPNSRSSLGSSRLSSSHNSLSVPAAHRVDDSSFIMQAVSHDTLSSNQIRDLYNVPFDSDMYAVPVDVVKPPLKPKKIFGQQHKKSKRRNTSSGCRDLEMHHYKQVYNKKSASRADSKYDCGLHDSKRHSVAGTSAPVESEPIHMTLQEVRQYLQTLYSSSSDSSDHKEKFWKNKAPLILTNNNKYPSADVNTLTSRKETTFNGRSKKNTFLINIKNKKVKDSCDTISKQISVSPTNKQDKNKKITKMFSLKQTLCNMFRLRRFLSPDNGKSDNEKVYNNNGRLDDSHINIISRALPPLPSKHEGTNETEEHTLDFATSIQRVKDYGWYWGPISSEAAEKILSNEPDGSFIVRDSSDDHYIFSLTFKLNNCVRHVRIEHDQGNFSFGSCTKFKSQTIVEFIENAVEHSRSGRYLFFLHRRPVIGPVRVQLLHPVSRFKQVQSLQHICRFTIHKVVRRDLIPSLPLPRRMIDYLNTPHYYSEHLVDMDSASEDHPPTPSPLPESDGVSLFEPATPNIAANDYVIVNNARQS